MGAQVTATAARSQVVLAAARPRCSGAALVPQPCSYAQGGFSEGKSLLFHPKSALKPLQGQVLAQQNVLVAQWGNSQHGVGKGKADGGGAAWGGEPGSCGPSEQGSLTWRESFHQNPGRSLLSPSKLPPSCASLCHPLFSAAAPAMAEPSATTKCAH